MVRRLIAGRETAALLLVATGVLLVFYYAARPDVIGVLAAGRPWTTMAGPARPLWLHLAGAVVLLAGLPILLATRGLGLRLGECGLGLGRIGVGLRWLAAGLPLAVLAGWVGAQSPAMRAVYPLDPTVSLAALPFGVYALAQFLYFGAWEVLFRGVLLHGLTKHVGFGAANALQTALSVTAHFGRAINEAAAALPGGLLFGWLARRTGSIWYVAILHWAMALSMEWFIRRGL